MEQSLIMFNGTPNQTYVSHRYEAHPKYGKEMQCILWDSPRFSYRSYRDNEGALYTFRVDSNETVDNTFVQVLINHSECQWVHNLFQEHFGSPTREYSHEDQTDPWEANEPAPRFVLDTYGMCRYDGKTVPSIDWYRGDCQYRTFLLPDGKLSTHKRWDEDGGGISNWTVDNELLAQDVACLHGSFTKLFGKRCQPVPEPAPANYQPTMPKLFRQVYINNGWLNVQDIEQLPQYQHLFGAINQVFGDSEHGKALSRAAFLRFAEYLDELPQRWKFADEWGMVTDEREADL